MNGLKLNYKSYFGKDFVSLCFFDKEKDRVIITACLCTEGEDKSPKYKINGQEYRAEIFYSQAKNIEGRVINFNYFRVSVPMDEALSGVEISFGELPLATFSQFPVDRRAMSYYKMGDLMVYLQGDALNLINAETAPVGKIKKAHRQAMRRCFETDRKGVIKALVMRLAHNIAAPFFKKEVWLIADRKDKGGDNGESFFEYLSSNTPKGVLPCFVINKNSLHIDRIRKMGRVLYPRSFRYKLYYTFATRIVASQLEYDIVNPILARDYLKDILNKCKIVFLQHGIIKDDLSPTYNRYERPMDMFVTSTVPEYESIAKSDAYGYGEKIVKLTGLARFDKLESKPEKIIFVCPSWRKYCVKDTETREPVDNVEATPAHRLYKELLTSTELIDKAMEKGYKICFYPHYLIEKCFEGLDLSHPVFINPQGITYRDMFCRGSLLVTDYSSVQFDFAYLKKPVVYCQPDREELFATHTYVPGYFDYERDGFGEVTYNSKELISTILRYIDTGCALSPEYGERIESSFAFNDRKCCERILNEVIKLDNEHKD